MRTFFLNSSQAFAFNVFFPWMQSEATREVLLRALDLPDKNIRTWSFERMIDPSEGTSVDFFAELGDGSRLLVEVKFTEEHFGQCVPGEAHRKKLTQIYRPRLTGRVHDESLEESVFFLNYPLFRNVRHLAPGSRDTLLLLLPRANTLTWAEAESSSPTISLGVRGVGFDCLLRKMCSADSE